MTDGDGLASLAGVFGGEFELMLNRSHVLHIIQEGNIAIRAWHTSGLRGVIRDGGRSSAAIDKEQTMTAQKRHQFGHQPGV
jgi:hypothetical protein